MRIVSRIVLVIGLLVVVVGLAVAAKTSFDVFGNMQPKNSVDPVHPLPWMWAAVGLALLGGLVTGLGLGMPKSRRRQVESPAGAEATTAPEPG